MPELVLTNIDSALWASLERRASCHGTSTEDEARTILAAALSVPDPNAWAIVDAIRERLPVADQRDSMSMLDEDRSR